MAAEEEQEEKGASSTPPKCTSLRIYMGFYSQCPALHGAEPQWTVHKTRIHSPPYSANGS